MPARLGLLGAEHGPEVVDAAERHGVGLCVELPALREKDFLILEIVDREERRRALARRRSENRRVGEDEPLVVEKVAYSADDLMTHAKDRRLLLRTNPQVTPIEQVIDPVLLRSNRVVRRRAHDLEVRDIELESAWCAAVGAHSAVDDQRGLLRQVIGLLEFLVTDCGLRDNGLDESRAVAHRQKVDLSARAAVVKPSADRDRLSLVLRDLVYVSNHSSGVVPTFIRPVVPTFRSAIRLSAISASSRRRAATARSSTARVLSAAFTSYINTPS